VTSDAGTSPVKVLRGRLTFLRAAERDDIPLFVRWLNDERTVRFLAARAPIGHAQEEGWLDGMLARQGHDSWFFVICSLSDDRPIGTTGLFEVDLTNGNAGIGILIGDPADQGKGLGTDAMEALLDFGFGELRLERMWLDVYAFNPRGVRSYEKAGFVHEGTLRHAVYRRRGFHDVHRMAILRAEWADRRAADPFPGPPTEGPGSVPA
jgi:RimJ/RimL family protein N-acetyltransferase